MASFLVIPASAALAMPALAECVGNPNRWPAFERVAPTARQVVVGRVSEVKAQDPAYDYSSSFTLEVEEVLRGPEPAAIEFEDIRSGLPLRGEQSCRDSSSLSVHAGDRIALALGGRLPGVKGRVNSAAWIEGRKEDPSMLRGLARMSLDQIRQAAGLEPQPSFEAVLAGDAMSISEESLILEGVPAVTWTSQVPEPAYGVWDLAAFAQAFESDPSGMAASPSARLSIAGYVDPETEEVEEVVLEVTDVEVDGDQVRLDFIPVRGPLPFLGNFTLGTYGPSSLTIDIDGDPADFPAG
jgi:hypothetical protein